MAARPLGPLDILWTTVGVLVAAALLQPALAWLAGLSAPLGADWLNPFSQSGSRRLYKTGDLVRWSAETNLEFLGRIQL